MDVGFKGLHGGSLSLLAIVGCATNAAPFGEQLGYQAGKTYLDEDGLPVYMCSPPADDSYIFSFPFHESRGSMYADGFSMLLESSTWIYPLQGVEANSMRWRDDGTSFEYETKMYMTLTAEGLEHPIAAQGEQVMDEDAVFGDNPWATTDGYFIWEDTRYFGTLVSSVDPGHFNPSSMCLSRIRQQRVQGFYSYWPDPETTWAESLAPFNITYYFDFQGNTSAESAESETQHEYLLSGKDRGDSLHVRDLGNFYWSYSDSVDPDELWSADALPDGVGE